MVFLNHGSFGATPLCVTEHMARLRARMEAEPIRFFVRELEPLLDAARLRLAAFVGCDADDFAFIHNATAGVSTVIRSLPWRPGDEIVTSGHEYNACNNALDFAAQRLGARVVRARIPFPVASEDHVVAAILAAVTDKTRLVLLSHITSPTALVLPVKRIVAELSARGVDTLVDGAHAPGFLPLHVSEIGAAYYTGNFHKWLCAPKGAAFLHVRRDRQDGIVPLIISHGANSTRTDRSRFRLMFDFLGSMDYSPWLATPAALDTLDAMVAGGWPEIMRRNRTLALEARRLLLSRLGGAPTSPESMVGCLAAARLPDRAPWEQGQPTHYHDPLQDRLIDRWRIQVPIIPFSSDPSPDPSGGGGGGGGGGRIGGGCERYVRVAAQVYNTLEQIDWLAEALLAETATR